MHNFPTHFWRKFQEYKERPALWVARPDQKPVEETYWEWTRRVQRLAIALLEAGMTPGERIALLPKGGRDWLDLAFASWLIGGCLVVIPPSQSRQRMLRALARTGSAWVVLKNEASRQYLEGEPGNLPAHLRWILLEEPKQSLNNEQIFTIKRLGSQGRSLVVRGWVDKLARSIYAVKPDSPALILFDNPLSDDPHGAFFSGEKVAELLDYIGEDLQLSEDARVVSGIGFTDFPAWLISAATLLRGHALGVLESCEELPAYFQQLSATHLICDKAFLEQKIAQLRADLDTSTSNQGIASPGTSSTSGFTAWLSEVGKEAARRLFKDPLTREFGASLGTIYLVDGRLSDAGNEVFEGAEIDILGLFAMPEAGISHIERAGAQRRDTVGRPVQTYACKIRGARREGTGEVLLRSHLLFDGYWDDRGPRQVDEEGWLHTGRRGYIQSGFLYLEQTPKRAADDKSSETSVE